MIGFIVVGQLIHYALLPTAIALVAWGVYRIYTSERSGIPRATTRRSKSVKIVRLDPKKDLTVPKDWQ
ncbi:MAG: hypothetical protein NVS3B16_11330 [Vulcanimicrobiaceae bacterium]